MTWLHMAPLYSLCCVCEGLHEGTAWFQRPFWQVADPAPDRVYPVLQKYWTWKGPLKYYNIYLVTRQNTNIAIYNVAGSRYHDTCTAPRTCIKVTTVDTYDAQTYTQIIITKMHAWKNRGKYSIKNKGPIFYVFNRFSENFLYAFYRFTQFSMYFFFSYMFFSGKTYDSCLNFMCSFSQFPM